MAERNGSDLRRWLASAERLSEAAMARAERRVNTPRSRSSALLRRLTSADQHERLRLRGGDFMLLCAMVLL